MFPIRQHILSSTCSLLIALNSPLNATELPSSCTEARMLRPTDQERRFGDRDSKPHCYRLDLRSPGLLHLNATVPFGAPSVHLDVLKMPEAPAAETLERAAAERLMIASAGTYFIVVAGDDPRRPMPDYRLGSRFVEVNKSDTDGEIEVEPDGFAAGYGQNKSDTDGEIEVEPDGFVGGCGRTKSDTDGEIEVEPDGFARGYRFLKSDTDGEIEVEPDGFVGGCGRTKSDTDGEIEVEPDGFAGPALIEHLCRTAEADDHGDTLICATPLASRVTGELSNGWGDDVDVFRFQVRHWQTVEILLEGGTDLDGRILDRNGQRLTAADDRDDGGNFRRVHTLAPGTYFVRVEAAGSDGFYRLTLRAIER